MNFHDPDMAAGGKVVLLTGPFGAPERSIALDRPMAIAEIIGAHDLAFRLPTIAVMDGEPVLRGCWAVRVVRPGDVLAFVAVPRGGGEGGGQGKQVAGLIAALALSIAAPMIGGWVAGAMFGGSALAANLVTAAVMLGGGLLLNALFPPPQQVSVEAEQVYSVNAANNQATPLEVLPTLYGELEFAPRHASRPYSEYVGNDQYLYQLLHVTTGMATVKQIKIGETIAWSLADGYSDSFSDLEFEIVQPGQPITLFPANVVTAPEVSGQTVPDPAALLGPFTVNAAGTTIGRLAVDFAFPGGLWKAASKGVARNSIALRAQYRAIDAAGVPLGGWQTLFAETIAAATRTPQRMSRAADVAPGRYEVQFLADHAFDPDDGNAINRVAWTGLRGYLTDFVTPPNTTLLAMKIRANEQLSQFSSNQIRVLALRHLPVWDGSAWILQETRSIAWATADLLMNADYAIGLDVQLIDLAQLSALAGTWASRGDTFNAIFDRGWTVQDALRAMLRAGRAQPVRMAGRIGFVRLEPKLIKRAMFTARNVVRGSFSHKLVLFDEEKPDHVIGSYIDGQTWRSSEVVGSLAAVGVELPQKVEWFGITDHDQAWRETVTEAAVNAYAREFVNFTAEWEGKLLVRGEPILVQHPFIEGVETVSLVARAGDKLTIDRDPSIAVDGDVYVVLRSKSGSEWGPCLVETISGREVTLNAADRVTVESQMGSLASILPRARSERAHILLCAGDTRPFNGLVVSAVPSAAGKVDILAVIDAPEVYLADATEIMPSPWTPPVLPPQNPARPLLLGLYAQLKAGIAQLELDAMWRPTPGAIGGYVAEVSYDDDSVPDINKSWTPVYAGMANRFTVPVLPQKLVLRVAAVGVLQGPWSKRVFTPGDVPSLAWGPFGSIDLSPEVNAARVTALRTIEQHRADTDAMAALLADALLGGASDRQELRTEVTARFGTTEAKYDQKIEVVAGELGALVTFTEALKADYDGSTANFTTEINTISTGLGALAGRTDMVEATVNDEETGLLAVGTAFSQFQVTVNNDLEAKATAITAVEAVIDSSLAGGQFVTEIAATTAGAEATIGLSARATFDGITALPAIKLDARVEGGVLVSDIGLVAARTYIVATDIDGAALEFFQIDGTGVSISNGFIKNLTAENITVDKLDANEVLQAGSVLEDVIAANAITKSFSAQATNTVTLPAANFGDPLTTATTLTLNTSISTGAALIWGLISFTFTATAPRTQVVGAHVYRNGVSMAAFAGVVSVKTSGTPGDINSFATLPIMFNDETPGINPQYTLLAHSLQVNAGMVTADQRRLTVLNTKR